MNVSLDGQAVLTAGLNSARFTIEAECVAYIGQSSPALNFNEPVPVDLLQRNRHVVDLSRPRHTLNSHGTSRLSGNIAMHQRNRRGIAPIRNYVRRIGWNHDDAQHKHHREDDRDNFFDFHSNQNPFFWIR